MKGIACILGCFIFLSFAARFSFPLRANAANIKFNHFTLEHRTGPSGWGQPVAGCATSIPGAGPLKIPGMTPKIPPV